MALSMTGQWLASGVALLLLVVFLMAVIDVPLQAYLFKSRLKMSHEEVKQEHKESDGNPQIKSKIRSEEHTSELQSQSNLVCRLLLEKKKKKKNKKRKTQQNKERKTSMRSNSKT